MHFKLLFLLFFAASASLTSCSDDDDLYVDRRNEENRVKVIFRSNTPGVPILVNGGAYDGGPLYIKDYWEDEFLTKSYAIAMSAQCDDEKVLISGEIYVNGKLHHKAHGNKYVYIVANPIKRDKKRY